MGPLDVPGGVHDFKNRREQKTRLVDLLQDESVPLIVVMGVEGIGKTCLLNHVLSAAQRGDDLGDGARLELPSVLLYLEFRRGHLATMSALLSAIGQFLPSEAKGRLRNVIFAGDTSAWEKARALANEFEGRRVLIVIDDFEEVLDPDTQSLRDPRLQALIEGLLDLSPRNIKVVVSTSAPMDTLWRRNLGKLEPVPLKGFPDDIAKEFLRERNPAASQWLERLGPKHRDMAWKRLGGHPKALKAFAAYMAVQPHAGPTFLLDEEALHPDVANALVGQTLRFLGRDDRLVLSALAIYGRPVPQSAIDELLAPAAKGTSWGPALGRLQWFSLVQTTGYPGTDGRPAVSEHPRFELYLADRNLLLQEIPEEPGADPFSQEGLTRTALLRRGADYLEEVGLSAPTPRTIEDLWPQLGEFDLLVRAGDFDAAVGVLHEIATTYLFTWGHADEVLRHLRRVDGKVSDPEAELAVAGLMGKAHLLLAEHKAALKALHRAHTLAEGRNDPENVARISLLEAGCQYNLGQVSAAGRTYQNVLAGVPKLVSSQAIEPVGIRTIEAAARVGLGLCLTDQGLLMKAQSHYSKARALLQGLDEPRMWVQLYVEWGRLHNERGEPKAAVEYYDAGLTIARQTSLGYRLGEGQCLVNKAKALIDLRNHKMAMDLGLDAARTGKEVGSAALVRDGNYVQALALLCDDELEQAQQVIDRVCRTISDPALHSAVHSPFALQGVIALSRGDTSAASEAFGQAGTRAKTAADANKRDYLAWDCRGLAAAGYLLRAPNALPREVQAAADLYRKARCYCSEQGAIEHATRLLNRLPDSRGVLAAVREAASTPYLP